MTPTSGMLPAVAGLALLAAAPLPAQVCAGFASLDASPYRVTARAAGHAYADARGASVTVGGRTLFATLGGTRLYDEVMDMAAYEVELEAGAAVSDERRRGFLCPLAALSASVVPADHVTQNGGSFRRLGGALGLGLAGVAVRRGPVALHPAASIRVVHLRTRYIFSTGHRDVSDDHVVLGAGIGVVVRDVLTIRPGVTIPAGLRPTDASDSWAVPYGREERELSFDLAIGLNFGRRGAR